ncbi:DinB family protein [Actinomycetota bacterium]
METTKQTLHRCLQQQREALRWKVEGLGERDLRRPLTPTGTNLLGLVKHVASVEVGYLSECFGRPAPVELPWFADDAEDNADMWATADESTADILALYDTVIAHDDTVIGELDLDAVGEVPWWPEERRSLTFAEALVRCTAETARHAGHADIVRELIDGESGYRPGVDNLPPGDEGWWRDYVARVQAAADEAARRAGE